MIQKYRNQGDFMTTIQEFIITSSRLLNLLIIFANEISDRGKTFKFFFYRDRDIVVPRPRYLQKVSRPSRDIQKHIETTSSRDTCIGDSITERNT